MKRSLLKQGIPAGRLALAAGCLLSTHAALVAEETESFTDASITMAKMHIGGLPVSLPKFNRPGTILTKAVVSVKSFDGIAMFQFENLDNDPVTVMRTEDYLVTFTPVGTTPISGSMSLQSRIETDVSGYDGIPDFGGTSGFKASIPIVVTGGGLPTYTETNPSALASQYTGSGTLNWTVDDTSKVVGFIPIPSNVGFTAYASLVVEVVYTYTVPVEDCSPAGTATIGYWKNHPEAWPVSSVSLGCKTYSKANAISQILGGTGSNASLLLAKQLLGAKLSASPSLCNTTTCVDIDIVRADQLLCQYPVGSNSTGAARNEILAVKTKLDDYNNGRLCEQHRD